MGHPVKTLEVMKLDFETDYPGLDEISERLDNQNRKNPVDILNWKDFNYKPEVDICNLLIPVAKSFLSTMLQRIGLRLKKRNQTRWYVRIPVWNFLSLLLMTGYTITSSSTILEPACWVRNREGG